MKRFFITILTVTMMFSSSLTVNVAKADEEQKTEVDNEKPIETETETTSNHNTSNVEEAIEENDEIGAVGSSVISSGKCGDDINYTLYADNSLVFEGAGEMYDYEFTSEGLPPWYNFKNLTDVVIEEGITRIGNYAFFQLTYKNLSLPSTLKEIGMSAFSGLSSWIKNLVIPENVEIIEQSAFANASNLKKITLSSNLKEIGNYAFSSSGLECLMIPSNVEHIGKNAFSGISKLSFIYIPESVTTIDEGLFGSNGVDDSLQLPRVLCESEEYQSGWSTINNQKLQNNSIYNVSVEEAEFWINVDENCENLQINSDVKQIFDYSLEKLPNVKYVYIPSTVETISANAFSNCQNIEYIYCESSADQNGWITGWNKDFTVVYGKNVNDFRLEYAEFSITFDSNGADSGAVSDMTGLKNGNTYNLPGNSYKKKNYKFVSWNTEVDGKGTRYDAGAEITITDAQDQDCIILYAIWEIDNEAIYWDVFDFSQKNIVISDEVTYIPAEAFKNNTKIETVVIPSSIKTIGRYAFNGCTSLRKVKIEDGITEIPYYCFYGCSNLSEINIPDSVKIIGSCSLRNCSKLETIYIPSTVENIDTTYGNVFDGCPSDFLIFIGHKNVPTNWNYNWNYFSNKRVGYPDEYLYVVDCTRNEYEFWASLNAQTENAVIPEYVDTMVSWVFDKCTSLKSVFIPKTLVTIKGQPFKGVNSDVTIYVENAKDAADWQSDWNICNSYNKKLNVVYGSNIHAYKKNSGLPDKGYIKYVLFEGTNNLKNVSEYDYKASGDITLYNAEKSGYKFIGWFEKDGSESGSWGKQIKTISLKNTNETTIYAMFTPVTYKITYNTNSGKLVANKNDNNYATVYSVATSILDLPDASDIARTGYTFDGWYAGYNSKTKEFTNKVESINDLVNFNGYKASTLYAKWTPITYTVIFDSNNRNVTNKDAMNGYSLTLSYDEAVILPANLYTRDGITFNKWSAEINGKTVAYANKAKVSNLTSTDGSTVVLKATWTYPKTSIYSITYNLNGGKNSSANPSSYNIDTEEFNLSSPTRTGYIFAGWYTDKAFTDSSKVTSINPEVYAGKYVLYAKWTPVQYSVTFAGSTGPVTVDNYSYDSSYKLNEDIFNIPGKTVSKWSYIDEKGKTKTIAGNASIKNLPYDEETKSITLTAVSWVNAKYTIIYNLDGGTNHKSNKKDYTIDTTTFGLYEPTKKGATFLGWYDNPEFEGDKVTSIVKGTYGNKTYYAKWKLTPYTITFNADGGTLPSSYESGSITYTVDHAITLENPIKAYNTFAGWYSGKTKVSSIKKGTTQVYNLTAKWTNGVSYTISYNPNSTTYSGKVSNTKVSAGKDVTLAANSYKVTNKIFVEWNTEPDGSGTSYQAKEKILKSNPLSVYGNETITLYAIWDDVKPFTIEFNSNNGTGTMSSQTMANNAYKALTANTFTRPGYTFTGWNTEPDGTGTSYNNKQTFSGYKGGFNGTVTLYAQWKLVTYKITYSGIKSSDINSNPLTYTVEDENISLYVAYRKNYIFGGFYSDSKYKNIVSEIETSNAKNITLYAKWMSVSSLEKDKSNYQKQIDKADDKYMDVYLKYYQAAAVEAEGLEPLQKKYNDLYKYRNSDSLSNRAKFQSAETNLLSYKKNNMPATHKIEDAKNARDNVVKECNEKIAAIDYLLTNYSYE